MVRCSTAIALILVGCAAAPACGGSAERAVPGREAGEPFGQPRVSSMPCDGETLRRLEARLRAQAQRELHADDGIVYSQTNSGCATLRVPRAADSRP